MAIAQQKTDWNFLGFEIREPLVIQANQRRDELGLTNLHIVFCNANNALAPLLSSLPQGTLHGVTIQFPDPWFKKRHQKRRVVQPELVDDLAYYLVNDGMILLQSDIEEVAIEMCDRLQEHPAFVRQGDRWLSENPLGVATDREQVTLSRGEPVYRAMFVKTT
jgi:tRNA (guanine-N7-)-methyltransferase